MKKQRLISTLALCAAVAVLGVVSAQDDAPADAAPDEPPGIERILEVLPYLSSRVPEHRLKAERLVESGAEAHFDRLLEHLPEQPREGRVILLRILANTGHEGRVKLCLDTLVSRDAQRPERTIAMRALRQADKGRLLALIEETLAREDLTEYERAQSCALLGIIPSARAQGVAESVLEQAEAGSLPAFIAEDAALRSTLAAPFAQPAWSRYQRRHESAPRVTLRELQDELDQLALPRAPDRAMAEFALADMIGGDTRVLLALARSPWPERAGFALKQLKEIRHKGLSLAAQAVVLDLVTTGETMVALMALDVAIAGAPPTDEEMEKLRPVVSSDSAARLEAILEGMSRNSNLAELRLRHDRLHAQLRPLLLRRSAFDPEVSGLLDELETMRTTLERLETDWENGWRREFQEEILGAPRER